MKKKMISLILSVSMLITLIPGAAWAESGGYGDVPADHWSAGVVKAAGDYKLMEGIGDGVFGLGNTITKAEFVTVLTRMFGWETAEPAVAAFADVAASAWYYPYVETALAHNVMDRAASFNPETPITREEMAVMLVRGLGYDTLAQSAASFKSPFTDVTGNAGYITIASDIGMTKGTTPTTFSPSLTAKREEAAAMLVRVYEKIIAATEWTHGFYAISSYSQKELTQEMDAVSLGWARMSYSADKGAYLNTTSAEGNEYNIPEGYDLIASYLKGNGTKTHLSVYMDTWAKLSGAAGATDACSAILLDAGQRTQAVNAIVNELTVSYNTIGYNPYSGVTIDFEGMKGAELSAGFNSFLTELSAALKPLGKTLYVTVQPATPDGQYYDAYDFRTIGALADKVILMAHDYNGTTMPDHLLGSEYHKNTPVTPFASVYFALKAATDESTGVEEPAKLALAISFASVGWELADGKVAAAESVKPVPSTIYTRLKGGAVMDYSQIYRNPYITYTTEEGKNIFLWYEDERSIEDKLDLAKLFGVRGVSLWRLGMIPAYDDAGLYYNAMDVVKGN